MDMGKHAQNLETAVVEDHESTRTLGYGPRYVVTYCTYHRNQPIRIVISTYFDRALAYNIADALNKASWIEIDDSAPDAGEGT